MRIAAALMPLLLSTAAIAAPPAGTPTDTPEAAWWRAQHNMQTGTSCCGAPGQDGYVLNQWVDGDTPQKNDWRFEAVVAVPCQPWTQVKMTQLPPVCWNRPSGYEVYIDDAWIDVPNKARTTVVGDEPDMGRRYKAKAWYRNDGNAGNVYFYCLQIGGSL